MPEDDGVKRIWIGNIAKTPREIIVEAGDRIWLERTRLTLKPDKSQSTENIEVIDVVEDS